MEFHHIACARDPECIGNDAQPPAYDQPAALFGELAVVRPFVQDFPLRRPSVFRPYLLEVDQSPLPAAEGEMLKPRKQKQLFLGIHGFRSCGCR